MLLLSGIPKNIEEQFGRDKGEAVWGHWVNLENVGIEKDGDEGLEGNG